MSRPQVGAVFADRLAVAGMVAASADQELSVSLGVRLEYDPCLCGGGLFEGRRL